MGKKKKENKTFNIKCFHVDDEVTGSSFMVTVDGLKILLDIGGFQSQIGSIEQKYKVNERKTRIPFEELDYIILSSAHADHCCSLGLIGKIDSNFNGTVISTELSQELIKLNVLDSAFLMKSECDSYNKKHNKNLKPLFSMGEAENAITQIRGYGYNEKIQLNKNTYVQLIPNGHLCGDASILITYENEFYKKRLLYTGDHNYGRKKPFTKQWNIENLPVDTIITEATYAGREHDYSNQTDKLENYIMQECVENKRTLLIASFSIHRSTELAYMIKNILERNEAFRDANIPIYFAGSMLTKAHRILGNPKHKPFYDEEWQDEDELFNYDKFKFIESFQEVQRKLVNPNCKIIVCSQGMFNNSYSQYLTECYVGRKDASFLASGYQAVNTIGKKLLDGEHKTISINGKQHTIRANILGQLDLSGHADDKHLRRFIRDCELKKLKKVIIVHGTEDGKKVLKDELESDFRNKDIDIIIPKSGEVIKV